MTQVGPRHGRLLGPLWANPDEILRGKQSRLWLRTIQFRWDALKYTGATGEKLSKTEPKMAEIVCF